MGSLTITLLGPPAVRRDGEPVGAPKGKKVWALLGYLARAGAPVSRERLASLLFADADDPLGALRWNLAELRRLLDDRVILRGEPLVLQLPPGTSIDVDDVLKGSWRQAVTIESLGGRSWKACGSRRPPPSTRGCSRSGATSPTPVPT